MSFLSFLLIKLTSSDRVEKHFAYLITFILFNTTIYILLNPNNTLTLNPILTLGSSICNIQTLIIFTFIYIIYSSQLTYNEILFTHNKINIIAELTKTFLFFTLMLSLLIFYKGSNHIQYSRYLQSSKDSQIPENIPNNNFLWDSTLITIDTQLLPIFPKGQVSLYLDTQPTFGTLTTSGKIYAEILQIFYISYYFWGNALGLYLTYYYYLNLTQKHQKRTIYRLILMFLTSWLGAFFLNLTLNLVFPAVSPRIYLKNEYQNQISGFLFCDLLRSSLDYAANNTFGAFPSSHCTLSWIVPILAYRINMKIYTHLTFWSAILISISTLVMRYHYFIDFLVGFIVVFVSCWFGGFLTQKEFQKSLELENLDCDEFNFADLRDT
jgi:membrane-associated phospholipid phosphatase